MYAIPVTPKTHTWLSCNHTLTQEIRRHIPSNLVQTPSVSEGQQAYHKSISNVTNYVPQPHPRPNPNIDVLSLKPHLVQNEWGTDGVMGKLLSQAYQVFLVEVGLHGNIFDYSFEDYGDLATHGFFRNMWQLLWLFGAWFKICGTFDIPHLW